MIRMLTVACAGLLTSAAPLLAQRPEDEPLQVVQAVFDGMRARDTARMHALFHPSARLMTSGVRQGAPHFGVDSVSSWLKGVAGATEVLDERLHDIEVKLDGNLAMVWARYDLFVGTRHSHCGVDLFVLARTPDGWKIVDVADTRRREGCRP